MEGTARNLIIQETNALPMRLAWLVVVLLAGCGSAPQEAPLPEASERDDVVHQDEDDVIIDEVVETTGRSDVSISARDTAGTQLPGVHAFLMGSDHSGMTDADGRVVFQNVTPGIHTVRLEKEYYRVVEANFTVVAGQSKSFTVRMPVAEGLLSPPHRHDAWNGRDAFQLFDEEWDLDACASTVCAKEGVYKPANGRFHFPDGAVIPPGTGTVNITLSWTGPQPHTELIVRYPRNASLQWEAFEFTPGATFSIDVEPISWDPPHATVSAWHIEMRGDAVVGALQVTVDLVRGEGDLPLDPPHPDLWDGRTAIRLRDVDVDYVRSGGVPGVLNAQPAFDGFDDGRFVYPGATELIVRAWINETINLDGWRLEISPYHGASSSIHRPQYRFEPEVVGVLHKWKVSVQQHWYDPIYASETQWGWRIVPTNVPNDDGPALAEAEAHIVIDLHRGT